MSLQLFTQLALIGICVGSVPLIYSAVKGDRRNYSNLVWLVLFLTFDLIVFGAFTRLTDSGLGCPDWPGCYGHSNPLGAMDKILTAQEQMPMGPVTVSKAWIEMLHRYFAMGVGFLLIILTVTAWVKRAKLGNKIAWASLGLLILVMIQGAFGAWTVTLKLQPIIVTIHLMLGLLLLSGLTLLSEISTPNVISNQSTIRFPIWIPMIGIIVLSVQIFLGGWVSTNYAVLACTDFPLCQGQVVPDMDFHHGFTWWRELGKTATGEFIDIKALVAIHWMHRVGAFVTLFAIAFIWRRASKAVQGKTDALSQRIAFWAKMLGWLGVLQLLTGLSNVVLEWPLVAALAHTAGAAALLVSMTKLTCLANKTS